MSVATITVTLTIEQQTESEDMWSPPTAYLDAGTATINQITIGDSKAEWIAQELEDTDLPYDLLEAIKTALKPILEKQIEEDHAKPAPPPPEFLSFKTVGETSA